MAFKMELTLSSLVPASSLKYQNNLEILELAKIPVSVFDSLPFGEHLQSVRHCTKHFY